MADFERAIRHGVRADGHGLMLMPSQNFQYMDDADVTALIAYVRSVPPVDHVQPPSRVAPLGYLLLGAGRVHLAPAGVTQGAPHPSALPSGPLAAYGKYLVDVAGCRGCHGPALSGRVVNSLSVTHLIAGARDGVSTPAANLTPAGLGTWTEADFFRSLREGKLPGGGDVRAATSDRGMPWQLIGQMTDDELRAIWAYLKILPPRPYGKG